LPIYFVVSEENLIWSQQTGKHLHCAKRKCGFPAFDCAIIYGHPRLAGNAPSNGQTRVYMVISVPAGYLISIAPESVLCCAFILRRPFFAQK
jgi:hypothetical protein